MSQTKHSSSFWLWMAAGMFGLTLITSAVFGWCFTSFNQQSITLQKLNNTLETKIKAAKEKNTVTHEETKMFFSSPAQIYEFFSETLRHSGLTIKRYSLAKMNKNENLPLEINILGDYPKIVKFLKRIHDKPYMFEIKKISLHHIEDPQYTIEAQVYMDVPWEKGAGK